MPHQGPPAQVSTHTSSAAHLPKNVNISDVLSQTGWGSVCSIVNWAPPFSLMPEQASLFGSGVPLQSPLRGPVRNVESYPNHAWLSQG